MTAVHVLYRFYNASNDLIYVGMTAQPMRRFRSHQKVQEWWPEVANITVENFGSRAELAHAEYSAITSEKPLYNVTYNDRSDSEPDVPAVGRTYNLDVATDLIVGDNSGLGDPQRWVVRRLRQGIFTGSKVGRNWFMSDADIAAARATLRNNPRPQPESEPSLPLPLPTDIRDGLSERARRRLRNAQ